MDDKTRTALAAQIQQLDAEAAKADADPELVFEAAVLRGRAWALREALRLERARRRAA